MMPVIRDRFSQQAADTTQWDDTFDWTVRCDWLQVASSRIILYAHNIMLIRAARLAQALQHLLQVLSYSCDVGLRDEPGDGWMRRRSFNLPCRHVVVMRV